jgi:PEGA domain
MSMRRVAALQSGFLLVAMLASATSTKSQMQITVLDSITRASTRDDNNGVPKDCDQLTFDAYCRSTTNVPLVSTLLVQEGNEPPFRISCRIESKFSRCIPLPKGETFEAQREKHGIVVYYVDDKGKPRKQLYTLVAGGMSPGSAVAAQPHNAPAASPPAPAPVPAAAVTPAPSAPATVAQGPVAKGIKCNFSSTPSGAEITLDGKFVGSTPSQIEVGTGTHVIVFSMPGFAEWKRDLTVIEGSELTVSAILQKQQP